MTAVTPIRTEEFEAGVLAAMPRLYGSAMRLCRDHHKAQDLVSETVITALSKYHQFEPGSHLIRWLLTILRNEWYTQCRRAWREVADVDGIFASKIPVDEGQSYAYDLKVIRKRMRFLNSLQRKAIELVAMNGYQYDEAAEMMGVAVGTVKSQVHRARAYLETGDASALEGDEIDHVVSVGQAASDRVAILYRGGASVSEIASATGLSRADIMQVVADRKLRRA